MVTKQNMKITIDKQVKHLQGGRKKNALLAQKALDRYPGKNVDLSMLNTLVAEESAHEDTINGAKKMLRVVYNMLKHGQKRDKETEDLLNKVRFRREPLAKILKKTDKK